MSNELDIPWERSEAFAYLVAHEALENLTDYVRICNPQWVHEIRDGSLDSHDANIGMQGR